MLGHGHTTRTLPHAGEQDGAEWARGLLGPHEQAELHPREDEVAEDAHAQGRVVVGCGPEAAQVPR